MPLQWRKHNAAPSSVIRENVLQYKEATLHAGKLFQYLKVPFVFSLRSCYYIWVT